MTSLPQKLSTELDWSQPEPTLDEDILLQHLGYPLTFEYLQPLLVSNMYAVQAAYDRRVTRENFSRLLIHSMNFNNCMARLATMQEMTAAMGLGQLTSTWMKQQEEVLRARADGVRKEIANTLELLSACREPGEPVS